MTARTGASSVAARARRLVLAAATVAGALGILTVAAPATAGLPGAYVNPLTADAPDPTVVSSGGVYYAFTTGGNGGHIQLFTSSDLSHWTRAPWPGALTQEPSWAEPGLEWAPSVAQFGSTWVMYYATFDITTQTECISIATSPSVGGPYHDTSSGPFVCQPGHSGDLDPAVYTGPDGASYLMWKSNPGLFSPSAQIWSQRLAPSGLAFAPGRGAVPLLRQDQGWETTIENPQMVSADGRDYLFYSGGFWMDSSYAIGYALCAGPTGPCTKPYDHPVVRSAGSVVGPGGNWAFSDSSGQWWMAYAAWTAGAVGYPGGARSLRIDPLCFVAGGGPGPGDPVVVGPTTTAQSLSPSCPAVDPNGQYRLVASDGGLFAYGGAPFDGSTGGQSLPAPVVGAATDPATGGYWEVGLAGHVYPFGAPFDGQAAGLVHSFVTGIAATPDGGGYWEVGADGSVYAFGDAAYLGGMAGTPLNSPIIAIAATPDGGGYWLVAADGGIFAFGDAGYFGSMGGRPLNQRIVGMAAMPDGGGYYLVAADGGIFAFGDAPFRGSTGGMTLNRPIVGMATEGAGGGYWLVAADGGVFAYGSAPFLGSTGGTTLNRPVVAMTPG